MTQPRTLRDAHAVVAERRPGSDAPPSVWLEFRRGNARIYEVVSDVDRGHHHEALYWMNYERRKAEQVEARDGLP